jgi:aspirochlorine biosynthesis cytochrome P450 monooxygenase
MMKYTESVFSAGVAFNGIPLGPLRKTVYFLGARQHRRDLDAAVAFVVPELERRMREQLNDPNAPKENDGIQWNLDLPLASPKEGLPLRHAHRILHLSFAATGTVAILITHMIYNVLIYPEYLEPLREEISACTAAHGGWTEKAMNEMWKLDSFIRETLRVQPPSVCMLYLIFLIVLFKVPYIESS